MADSQNDKITLTLDGAPKPELKLEPEEETAITIPKGDTEMDESNFTEEEKKMVEEFSETIDLRNSAVVLQYGASSQKKIADFSQSALESVRTKDLGEVGDMITDLVVELKGFSAEPEDKGFLGIFKKAGNSVAKMKAKYDKAEVNVDKICGMLEDHQIQLMKDITMLDKMYDLNLTYFKELTMYIVAGKKKLANERATTLVELQNKAKASNLPQDAQAANDFASQCDRFEKKLHDLELTRVISMQMAPQIRLVQQNSTLLTEKIQSSIVNTIPLWKSQMVLALGVAHSADAVRAQREVTDMTNMLLKKNAEKLKMSTIETARESERGIVDMETLRQTNQSLITTLDEVVKIQEEGKVRRREAEQELGRLEGELKQKLLDIRA